MLSRCILKGWQIGFASGLDVMPERGVKDVSKVTGSTPCKSGFGHSFQRDGEDCRKNTLVLVVSWAVRIGN